LSFSAVKPLLQPLESSEVSLICIGPTRNASGHIQTLAAAKELELIPEYF